MRLTIVGTTLLAISCLRPDLWSVHYPPDLLFTAILLLVYASAGDVFDFVIATRKGRS